MSVPITRHMATVKGERQVHYRRAGTGPPVLLLHQSPTSSREYIPLIRELAAEYTVFAPDSPGNGLSDPLAVSDPEMSDYADGVADLMDELGLKRAPVYGFHTGAVCTLELARRHPKKVVVGISNGYVEWPPEELAEFLANYLPPLKAEWSGAHLTWTWARFREQYIFFPWYRKDVARRMNFDLPGTEAIHTAVMDFLRAGDNYRRTYRAAFTHDSGAAVQEVKAKMVIMTARTDPLFPYLDAMPKPSPSVTVLRPDTAPEAIAEMKRIFAENKTSDDPPPVVPAKPMPGRIWADYLQTPEGSFHCRRNTDGAGRPVLFVHASASSSRGMDVFMTPFIGRRPVLAVDLPGNGESDNPMGKDVTVEAQAGYLAMAVKAAGYDEVDVFGYWGGCAVALELAVQNPALVKHLAVPTLIVLDGATREKYLAHYTPEIPLEDYGGHFIKAWNMLRDQELFSPWFERKKANIIRSREPNVAPDVIHRRTVDLFKCLDIYRAAYAAHFKYPVLKKLPQAACPVRLGDPNHPGMSQAAGAAKNADVGPLPADPEAAAANLLAFFDKG